MTETPEKSVSRTVLVRLVGVQGAEMRATDRSLMQDFI